MPRIDAWGDHVTKAVIYVVLRSIRESWAQTGHSHHNSAPGLVDRVMLNLTCHPTSSSCAIRFHSRLSSVSPAKGFTQSLINTGAPKGTGAGKGTLPGEVLATRGMLVKSVASVMRSG